MTEATVRAAIPYSTRRWRSQPPTVSMTPDPFLRPMSAQSTRSKDATAGARSSHHPRGRPTAPENGLARTVQDHRSKTQCSCIEVRGANGSAGAKCPESTPGAPSASVGAPSPRGRRRAARYLLARRPREHGGRVDAECRDNETSAFTGPACLWTCARRRVHRGDAIRSQPVVFAQEVGEP